MQIGGRRAMVTGGASGLGAATAAMLREAGAEVRVLDRAMGQDVLRDSDVDLALLGGVDIVVNCAGGATAQRTVGREGPLALEEFERVIRVNLLGTFNVIRLAAAAMMENPAGPDGERGVIVNTSSIAAFDGQIGQAAYAASKAAVAGMPLPLAREFARAGIRVVSIAPGLMDTPMMDALPAAVREEVGRTVPFPNRLGRPEEFALLVRQVVENPYLNGETIRLDGGIRLAPK
ncbi:MAG: SDR family NAD(P)-dependent oxidoreductase [Acidobacteriota bacterium]